MSEEANNYIEAKWKRRVAKCYVIFYLLTFYNNISKLSRGDCVVLFVVRQRALFQKE